MYNACSRAVVSWFALYVGGAKEASGQAVLVYGRATETASLDRVMGYVFISPQGEGHGVAVYDSFYLEAVS